MFPGQPCSYSGREPFFSTTVVPSHLLKLRSVNTVKNTHCLNLFPVSLSLSPFPNAHQVDKVLVADLSICVTVRQSQEHLLFVWVQFRAVALQEAPEFSCADVAGAPRVKLRAKHREQSQRNTTPPSAHGGPRFPSLLVFLFLFFLSFIFFVQP